MQVSACASPRTSNSPKVRISARSAVSYARWPSFPAAGGASACSTLASADRARTTKAMTRSPEPARSVCHQAVGKSTGSGRHYLESSRFPVWSGTGSSKTGEVEPGSPTSGFVRPIFRQPPTVAIVARDRVVVTAGDPRIVCSHNRGLLTDDRGFAASCLPERA